MPLNATNLLTGAIRGLGTAIKTVNTALQEKIKPRFSPHPPMIDNDGLLDTTATSPPSLSRVINNGNVHLGGYITDVTSALAKSGLSNTVTFPANSTSYLYLIRVDTDKLITKITTVNEPNTFYKIKIGTFVTNASSVTSATVNKIDHVTNP